LLKLTQSTSLIIAVAIAIVALVGQLISWGMKSAKATG